MISKAAASALNELKREMGAAVDAARADSTARNRWIASVLLAFVLGVLSNFVF